MYVDLLMHLFVYQQDKQANEFLRIQVLCSHAGEHDACDVTSEVIDVGRMRRINTRRAWNTTILFSNVSLDSLYSFNIFNHCEQCEQQTIGQSRLKCLRMINPDSNDPDDQNDSNDPDDQNDHDDQNDQCLK